MYSLAVVPGLTINDFKRWKMPLSVWVKAWKNSCRKCPTVMRWVGAFCPQCGQKVELEIGFWYGTGYVSYMVSVLFSLFNLAWYWIFIGISWRDDSVFHWLIVNGILLGLIMPGLIRWSRTLYLSFFVRYEPGADQK